MDDRLKSYRKDLMTRFVSMENALAKMKTIMNSFSSLSGNQQKK